MKNMDSQTTNVQMRQILVVQLQYERLRAAIKSSRYSGDALRISSIDISLLEPSCKEKQVLSIVSYKHGGTEPW